MDNHRSPEAARYRRWYSTARWRRIREAQLAEQPLCQICLQMEIVEPATVVHHADGGHKGDEARFWSGPFSSVCKLHHDSHGQIEDQGGPTPGLDAAGWPEWRGGE